MRKPAYIPIRDPFGKEAQVFITDYTIQSLLYTMNANCDTIDISTISEQYGYLLTTNTLGTYMPSITNIYGNDIPITMTLNFIGEQPKFNVNEKEAILNATLIMNIYINDKTGDHVIQAVLHH